MKVRKYFLIIKTKSKYDCFFEKPLSKNDFLIALSKNDFLTNKELRLTYENSNQIIYFFKYKKSNIFKHIWLKN